MQSRHLKTRIFLSFLAVIVMLSLAIGLLGWRTIKQDVIDRAQNQVRNNLFFAREIYQGEVNNVFDIVRFTAARYFLRDALIKNDPAQEVLERFGMTRQEESLDILSLTDARGVVIARARNPAATGDDQSGDEMVSRVLAHRKPVSGTVIVPAAELARESPELAEQARIRAIDTPRSKPGDEPELTGGMMIRAACPVFDYENRLIGVVYGGTLLNRRHAIVDRVKAIVFQDAKYDGKDVGNATIFQDDLRIATNVLNEDGTRAVGTRVSEDVYRQVIERGLP
ncbi:MAG: cache domain-containing protein, partial [Kiritimatiellia bacterium]